MAYAIKAHPIESIQGSHLPTVIPIGENDQYQERIGTIYGANVFMLPIALDTRRVSKLMRTAESWSRPGWAPWDQ